MPPSERMVLENEDGDAPIRANGFLSSEGAFPSLLTARKSDSISYAPKSKILGTLLPVVQSDRVKHSSKRSVFAHNN